MSRPAVELNQVIGVIRLPEVHESLTDMIGRFDELGMHRTARGRTTSCSGSGWTSDGA